MASKKTWKLNPQSFEKLLLWLDPDSEQAGKKYEEIRARLITVFRCRGNSYPEELADETINRVARKMEGDLAADYVGDPALYFYGVARRVHFEAVKKRPDPMPPPPAQVAEDAEKEDCCLEQCLSNLAEKDRLLILHYYRDQKRAKIEHRREIARKFGIAMNALRIRVYRIRRQLQPCLTECLGRA